MGNPGPENGNPAPKKKEEEEEEEEEEDEEEEEEENDEDMKYEAIVRVQTHDGRSPYDPSGFEINRSSDPQH